MAQSQSREILLGSTDRHGLPRSQAAAQIIELYAYDPSQPALAAFALVVRRMQPSTRGLAYHAIAHVMDWSDRARLWSRAGLDIQAFGVCAFE